jgi:hypothetical protein
MAGDTVWLAQGVDRVAIEIRNSLAHHLVRRPGVELHVARERQRVRAPLFKRLADVDGLDQRKVLDARADQMGQFREEAAALGRGQPPPWPDEGALGSFHGQLNVDAPAAGDRTDLDSARRIFDRQARTGLRCDPAPVDEALVGVEPGQL